MPPAIPEVNPTVPIAGLLLLHVPVPPDDVPSLNGRVEPTHTGPAPLIAPATGEVFTVTFMVVINDPHEALVSV